MSDDDADDRMDRAKRIRELREGRRVTGSDADPAEDGPDQDADADRSEDDSSDPAETAAQAGEDDSAGAREEPPDSDGDAPEAGDDEGAAHPTGGEAHPADDEATAAVQAAAQAAKEFEGEGGVAMDVSDEESTADDTEVAGGAAGVAETTADTEVTRVLEFRLGDELYCLDIAFVEEIVHEETVTRVPNTPEYVSGVVDLRGQITTILDPKIPVGLDSDVPSDEQLIVVFDAEQFEEHGNMGWLVDEVNQVTPIREEEVKDSPIQEAYINGIIERDDEFVIWTRPELALDLDED